MRIGRSLSELAAEIERQANSKKDMIASARALEMVPAGDGVKLVVGGPDRAYGVNQIAHEQIGNFLQIPRDYAEGDPMRLAA